MAAYRYWRLAGFSVQGAGALELSEARLYASGVPVDDSATISCPFVPASGALTDLKDGAASGVVSWPLAAHTSSGFALVWDAGLGSAIDAAYLRLGSGNSADTFPRDFQLQYSDDGKSWVSFGAVVDAQYPGPLTLTQEPTSGADWIKPTTWNPSDKGPNCALSNGNLTSSGSSAGGGVRSALGVSQGKWYWEMSSTGNLLPIVGVARSTATLDAYPGADANGWSYYGAGVAQKIAGGVQTAYGSVWSTVSHIVGVALDMDNGTLEFYKNGVSMGVAFTGLTGPVYAMNGGYTGGGASNSTANFGATPFAHSVPSGFTAGLRSGLLPTETPKPLRWRTPSPLPTVFKGAPLPDVGKAFSFPRVETFFDVYNGGIGMVYGTVKEKGTPANTPLRRKVLLIDERSRVTIRETWSNPVTGNYEFRGVKEGLKYTVLSYDHTGAYRATVADAQLPELVS